MAPLITLILVTVISGTCIGIFLKVCSAIRREDRVKGSLRFDAPNSSALTARRMVGMTSSRWS